MEILDRYGENGNQVFIDCVRFGPNDYEVNIWDNAVNDGWATSMKFKTEKDAREAFANVVAYRRKH